jgi:D-alanyl-D-alanine carboxypeptidase/D-alanyl-D-alanine-endopeptidase (penicillin-binding protein 4)
LVGLARPGRAPRYRPAVPVSSPHRALPVCALAIVAALVLAAPAVALDAAGLRRSLDGAMAQSRAGFSGAYVRDLTTGTVLYARRADAPRIPASVEKLFVTAAALRRHGPDARLTTRVVRTGEVDADGRLDGDLVLVGGGDPTLDPAALARLARAVERRGIRRVAGGLIGDESRFDAQRGGPRTGGRWDPDMGGVLGALTVNRGFVKGGGAPALAAARRLARALRARGVRVLGRTRQGRTPDGARQVARVRSAPLADLARAVNTPSDNFAAELLLKDLGASFAARGSTAAGARVATRELAELGVRPRIVDGSGLARANRASARQVVTLLAGMHASPLRAVFERSLAVAGRTGTLRRRLRGGPAAGDCRGKTGTLNRVSNLVGLCTTPEGHVVAFALLMNDVTVWRAHAAQDRAAAAVAAYVSLPFRSRLPDA